MLKRLLHSRIRAFERRYDYDMEYAHAILDTNRQAFHTYAQAIRLARVRDGVPAAAFFAAKLVVTLTGTVLCSRAICAALVASEYISIGCASTAAAPDCASASKPSSIADMVVAEDLIRSMAFCAIGEGTPNSASRMVAKAFT